VISVCQSSNGLSEQEIYQQSVNQLREYTGLTIDFDVKDAVRSLLELRIIHGAGQGYVSVPQTLQGSPDGNSG